MRLLDFLPVKSDVPPIAKFVDIASVVPIFNDVAEIVGLFNLPMSIEVKMPAGKNSAVEWWQKLAESQAALVRTELARCGAPASLLTAKGFAQSGVGRSSSVFMRFHKDVFPATTASGYKLRNSK